MQFIVFNSTQDRWYSTDATIVIESLQKHQTFNICLFA